MLNELTKTQREKIKILLRLTPGIEAHTHEYIKTGQLDSKFGFVMENGQAISAVKNTLNIKSLQLMGFHCHIGSQIFEKQPFKDMAEVMIRFAKKVNEKYGIRTREINFGGGFGIKYTEEDKPLTVGRYTTVLIDSVKILLYV